MSNLISGVHHISLHPTTAADYDRTVDFYCNTLGCRTIRSWDVEDRRGAFIDLGNCILELGLRDDGVREYGAVHHIALATTDLDALIPVVEAAGYPLVSPPRIGELPTVPPFQAYVAFIEGPCGESIEFFQEIGEV